MRKRIALLAACALMGAAETARADEGALERAVRADDVAGAKAALADGADPDQRLAYAATPLALAVDRQNAAMVELLLAEGADPDLFDAEGLAPLALACELGGGAIVEKLLGAGADVRAAGADGTTPLATCARFAPAATVAQMLKLGADARAVDARGQTPLMWAASSGNLDAMRMLLNAGADANRVTKGGFTPLFFAIKSKVPEATAIMLDAGADPAFIGPEDTSALQLALYQESWDAAAMLLRRGPAFDLAATDRNGQQPLHVAAKAGATEMVALLLEKGADPNGTTGPARVTWVTEANFGVPPPPVPPTPPLLTAAAHGNVDVMRLLVDGGARPDFTAQNGTNVTLAAAKGQDADALAYALALAPDANVANSGGATPLHLLLYGGMQPALEPMLKLLRDHGARTDIAASGGPTADEVAEKGLTEVRAVYDRVFTPALASSAH